TEPGTSTRISNATFIDAKRTQRAGGFSLRERAPESVLTAAPRSEIQGQKSVLLNEPGFRPVRQNNQASGFFKNVKPRAGTQIHPVAQRLRNNNPPGAVD